MGKLAEPRGIHRRTRFEMTTALRQRLNARVERRGANECWPWTGADRNGYGCIKHEGKCLGTHVVAFLAAGGVIGEGQLVIHSCDNRICCNPAHLSADSVTENNRQCFDRRNVNTTQGIKCATSILNDDIIRQIWAMRLTNGWGQVRIARAIAQNKHTVKHIINGRAWKHVAKPSPDECRTILAGMNIEVAPIKPSGRHAGAPKSEWAVELWTAPIDQRS